MTSALPEHGFSQDAINEIETRIAKTQVKYNFDETIRLNLPTTKIDTIPTGELVSSIHKAFVNFQPDTVFLPFCYDIHSDHYHICKAALSCCKWFRCPSIKNVLFYETISETDYHINSAEGTFRPNLYVDISDHFEQKVEALQIHESELAPFPFPRSIEAIESLAKLRGSQCGVRYAEAFMLLKGIL